MKQKPRIKIVSRGHVFTARLWRCWGFDTFGRFESATGWTPQEAYFNWQSNLTVNY